MPPGLGDASGRGAGADRAGRARESARADVALAVVGRDAEAGLARGDGEHDPATDCPVAYT